jgi:hypothetical protein
LSSSSSTSNCASPTYSEGPRLLISDLLGSACSRLSSAHSGPRRQQPFRPKRQATLPPCHRASGLGEISSGWKHNYGPESGFQFVGSNIHQAFLYKSAPILRSPSRTDLLSASKPPLLPPRLSTSLFKACDLLLYDHLSSSSTTTNNYSRYSRWRSPRSLMTHSKVSDDLPTPPTVASASARSQLLFLLNQPYPSLSLQTP